MVARVCAHMRVVRALVHTCTHAHARARARADTLNEPNHGWVGRTNLESKTDGLAFRWGWNFSPWEMIKSASSIHVAKGKKTISWNPKSDDREEILKTVMGPSGNLRAPTWKIGSDILVGFSEEQYQQVLG